jgi:AbrB family looped-hinge helix DNA binding protein
MNEHVPSTKTAERLLTRPEGATMPEIIAATGGPQYNLLKKLEGRGYRIRKVKEGRATRYYAEPPAAPSFEATVTSKGQVTIPREVRERLGLRDGQKVRFTLEGGNRVTVAPAEHSILDFVGSLPKPERAATIEEMEEGIRRGAAERYRRSGE